MAKSKVISEATYGVALRQYMVQLLGNIWCSFEAVYGIVLTPEASYGIHVENPQNSATVNMNNLKT